MSAHPARASGNGDRTAVVVGVLSARSGAAEADVRSAANLFESGILTSHSLASAAIELGERLGLDLLSDFRMTDWLSVQTICDMLGRRGVRA